MIGTPFLPTLLEYGFEFAGSLYGTVWKPDAAIYAFVARDKVMSRIWDAKRNESHLSDEICIEPSQVFYIGVSENIRDRFLKWERPLVQNRPWLLAECFRQRVPIDVYFRYVSRELVIIDGLPVNLLWGCEAALIRELQALMNQRHVRSHPFRDA